MTRFPATLKTVLVATALGVVALQPTAAEAFPRSPWTRIQSAPAIKGNTPVASWSRKGERCFEYPRHTVIESSQAGDGSPSSPRWRTVITVWPASTPCRLISHRGDGKQTFVVDNSFESFEGLVADVLITDSGTGPDGRVLTLYNVVSQSKIRQFNDYSDPVELQGSNKLRFWLPSGRATANNCPEYTQWNSMGLGAVVESQVVLNLDTNQLVNTNKRRCASRQAPVR